MKKLILYILFFLISLQITEHLITNEIEHLREQKIISTYGMVANQLQEHFISHQFVSEVSNLQLNIQNRNLHFHQTNHVNKVINSSHGFWRPPKFS